MTQDDDLDLMLADSDDTFTVGDVTTPCQLQEYDEVVGQSSGGAGQIAPIGNLIVRASAFPSIATNDPCLVNTSNYRVAQHTRIQDGRALLIVLGKAQ